MSVLSLSARSPDLLWVAAGATLLALFVGVGLSAVWMPLAPLVVLAGIWIGLRGRHFPGDVLLVIIAGNVILNFGFANLGLRLGGLPVPLTEMLFLPLVGIAVLRLHSLKELRWPGVFLVGFLVVTTVRLVFSLPQWGVLAVRDYTTSLEALALVVGFWAVKEYGLDMWIRSWFLVFLGLLLYSSLSPVSELLASSGPVVGLQRPVALLGHFAGVSQAAAAAFFFFSLMVRRGWSYPLGAWSLVILAIRQARSSYIAVPLAILVVAFASRRIGGPLALRLAAGLGLAVLVLFLVAPWIPSGRLGSISPSFYVSHVSTLFGAEGPSGGTIKGRQTWYGDVRDVIRAQPTAVFVGVGLGPDLIGGFRAPEGQLVRKPHNDYVEIFTRFGIVGAGLWVGLIASALRIIWVAIRQHPMQEKERRFLIWVLALATVYLLGSAVQALMAFPYGTIPFFTTLGMGLAVAHGRSPPPLQSHNVYEQFAAKSSTTIR